MRSILLLICALIGAALLSQAPEFAQQYRQNLSGRVDELDGATRVIRGETIQAGDAERILDARRERLAAHQRRLTEAGPFLRLVELARGYETDVAEATYESFEPAAPVTVEGLVHAAAGFAIGWLVGSALLNGVGARAPRRRRSA